MPGGGQAAVGSLGVWVGDAAVPARSAEVMYPLLRLASQTCQVRYLDAAQQHKRSSTLCCPMAGGLMAGAPVNGAVEMLHCVQHESQVILADFLNGLRA